MTTPRLFVDQPLAPDAQVFTSPAQTHYLAHVMRQRAGAAIHLFNGRDGEWLARIEAVHRDRADMAVERQLRPQRPDTDLWLLFALLKRDATDWVIEKATELGVSVLIPAITARTIAGRVNLERLAAIAIEASEQCERLTVPEIRPPDRLDCILDAWPAGRPLFVAAERSGAPALKPAGSAALLVGPEGGFSAEELDGLRNHPFVTLVSLGPRILRAETACLAGLALLQAPCSG